MIYVSGRARRPGRRGQHLPRGTYSEIYPNISQDEAGLRKLFLQFSFPEEFPARIAGVPGSIHEGGELGYSLSHSFGAVFDNPDLVVACVVGDGEAETGPLATAWHSNKFLNPATDGAVLPILHLNGYKISNPTVWPGSSMKNWNSCSAVMGGRPTSWRGTSRVDARGHGRDARHGGGADPTNPAGCPHPRQLDASALADDRAEFTKGWTDRRWSMACRFKARSVRTRCRSPTGHPSRTSQAIGRLAEELPAEELFDDQGRLKPELAELAPKGQRRMGANPHANGGMLLRDLRMPDFREYAVDVPRREFAGSATRTCSGVSCAMWRS